MEERILKAEQIMAYGRYLRSEERAGATVEKYLRSVRQFAAWREDGAVTKEAVTGWKEHLLAQGKAPVWRPGIPAAGFSGTWPLSTACSAISAGRTAGPGS